MHGLQWSSYQIQLNKIEDKSLGVFGWCPGLRACTQAGGSDPRRPKSDTWCSSLAGTNQTGPLCCDKSTQIGMKVIENLQTVVNNKY